MGQHAQHPKKARLRFGSSPAAAPPSCSRSRSLWARMGPCSRRRPACACTLSRSAGSPSRRSREACTWRSATQGRTCAASVGFDPPSANAPAGPPVCSMSAYHTIARSHPSSDSRCECALRGTDAPPVESDAAEVRWLGRRVLARRLLVWRGRAVPVPHKLMASLARALRRRWQVAEVVAPDGAQDAGDVEDLVLRRRSQRHMTSTGLHLHSRGGPLCAMAPSPGCLVACLAAASASRRFVRCWRSRQRCGRG